jgi:hypothetical protein
MICGSLPAPEPVRYDASEQEFTNLMPNSVIALDTGKIF